jgi:hypothetical protein
VVLTWLLPEGRDEVNRVLQDKTLITEEMVLAIPEKLHNGILGPGIDIESYRSYFDEDAWASVLSLGKNSQIYLRIYWFMIILNFCS